MSEVRRTTDSSESESEAKPTRNKQALPGKGAWGGWRRNGQKSMFMNQGDLSWCQKEQDRSQSPRSSDEAANPRGAKGGRKVET